MADELDAMFEEDGMELEVPSPEEATPPEPVAEEPAQSEPEQPAEPAPQPEASQPGFVPIAAMMDERDKRKTLEAELAQLRNAQAPSNTPTFLDDPDGFVAYQQQQVAQQLAEQRFAMSDMFARQQHGPEAVEKAMTWANERAASDPIFAAGYMQQQNPVDWIVRQHKQADLLGQIGDKSLDDFIKERVLANPAAFGLAPVAAAPAPVAASPTQAAPPARVPRSLATQGSGPSDVRDVATGPLAAVDAVFTS